MLVDETTFFRSKKKLVINITSLIDVLFLLLLFFMVTSTFVKNAALKVTLPNVKGEVLVDKKKSLEIIVMKDEKIVLNGVPITFSQLTERIHSIMDLSGEEKPSVHFKVDEAVSYGFAVKVMAKLKEAGIQSLLAISDPQA